MLEQHHGAMTKNAQEAGFMSGWISSDEPSFLLVISTLSDQGLIQMRLSAFGQTQENVFVNSDITESSLKT